MVCKCFWRSGSPLVMRRWTRHPKRRAIDISLPCQVVRVMRKNFWQQSKVLSCVTVSSSDMVFWRINFCFSLSWQRLDFSHPLWRKLNMSNLGEQLSAEHLPSNFWAPGGATSAHVESGSCGSRRGWNDDRFFTRRAQPTAWLPKACSTSRATFWQYTTVNILYYCILLFHFQSCSWRLQKHGFRLMKANEGHSSFFKSIFCGIHERVFPSLDLCTDVASIHASKNDHGCDKTYSLFIFFAARGIGKAWPLRYWALSSAFDERIGSGTQHETICKSLW